MQNFETTSRAGDLPSTAPWSGGNGIVTRVDRSGHDSRALQALSARTARAPTMSSLSMSHLCGVLARPSARARVALRRARDALVRDENANGRGARRCAPARRGAGPGARRLDSTRATRRARSREGILAPSPC